MTDQKSKHSIHMIIKLHAKTYPLLTKSNWTNSQTKNQDNHSVKSKSSQTNIHMTKKNNGKTKKLVWKISSTVISFTLKNTFQNDLFQKSNSKKKTENHIHVTKQFVIREHWGKKNPKSVSRKWKHASPPHQTPVNPLLRISLLGPSHQRLAPCISTTQIPLLHFICLIRNWETSKACF